MRWRKRGVGGNLVCMITTYCAICNKKGKLQELYPATFDLKKLDAKVFSARRTPDHMHYRFVKCQKCGLIFSNPILKEDKIAKLYLDSGFSYSQEAEYLKKTYWNLVPRLHSGSVKLLDVGCGNGFFLEEAKAQGVKDVWGVEPGEPSVKQAPKWLQKRIKIAMLKPRLFKAGSFDVVCCFHTLDHIVDPNAFLQQCRTLLKRGGSAVFVVHDTGGLSVKLFGEKSAIFDIEHIYLFNKRTLAQIFEQNGFEVVEVVDIKNTYPLGYWLRMVPVPGKSLWLRILEMTGVGKMPISIKAGNIGIIARKK